MVNAVVDHLEKPPVAARARDGSQRLVTECSVVAEEVGVVDNGNVNVTVVKLGSVRSVVVWFNVTGGY